MATLHIKFLWFVGLFSSLAEPAGENVKQFGALCTALQAARAPLDEPQTADDNKVEAVPETIKALYATATPDQYFNNETYGLFTAKADFDAIKHTLKNTKTTDEQLVYKRIPETPTKKPAETALERLYNKTSELVTAANAKIKNIKQKHTEARQQLEQALGGKTDASTVSSDNFTARPNGCTPTAANSAKQTLPQALVCLCSSTSHGLGSCGNTAGDTTYGTSGTPTAAATLYKTLNTKCPQPQALRATPATLTAAITAVQSAIGNQAFTGHTNTGTYVIGNGAGNDCGGANSETACVDYTEIMKNGDIANVAWAGNLKTAAAKLDEANKLQAELYNLRTAIKQNENLAWKIRDTADIVAAVPRQTTPTQQRKITEIDCEKNKENKTCTENNNCKWEGKSDTDGKCVVDETKATTQTNTAGAGRDVMIMYVLSNVKVIFSADMLTVVNICVKQSDNIIFR
uniref:Variant surface glycoprotein 1205 n=1 Tax=Trypanosoma brucei TaxID=5691 RepID=M4SUU5_9TRYP|nr:variant surface glycoprotein 1205 [Trypanosoma brucei]